MKVTVRHDQPIAKALAGRREGLVVVGADSEREALEALPESDAFVINPTNWSDEYLESFTGGRWIQATSAGYSAFPIEEFESNGIAFTNASGNYGPPVADHAFALALALGRGISRCRDDQLDSKWNRDIGSSLIDFSDRTLTVVGLGDIGEEVARRGEGFGMTVYGTKRDPSTYDGRLPADRVLASGKLDSLLPNTDVLVLAVPLTDETHHLVDENAIEALPDSAIVVNVARGPVIDERALVRALETDRIAGAGLDVFETEPLPEDSPLWDRKDVVITPHVGGRSASFVDRFVDLFLANHDRLERGEPLVNRIV
ncbi:D-2-hydroxyacid dehydrogenase [Natronorarus salvus]|uniref:D-2-hydroxyacid dehydrogenase n=1 Tax=Natronorarus salvus TaxID=3117733 RepID=UPI002F26BFBE